MGKYVLFQEGIVKSICHVYKHEDGRILHLLPILHIGEEQYYKDLMDYVGEKICVYEEMKFGSTEDQKENKKKVQHKNPKSLDEWIAVNENAANGMDELYGKVIKKYLRKIHKRDVQKLRRAIKVNLSNVDERITTIYHQIQRTAFSLTNMPVVQTALAEIMDLKFQFNEIDYVDDIPNRSNWVHADIKVEVPKDFDLKNALSKPSQQLIEVSKSQGRILYGILYTIITYIFMDLNERRKHLGDLIIPVLNNIEDDIPDHLMQPRNNIVIETADNLFEEHNEIVVFYGAAHMPDIEQAAIDAGFVLDSKTDFEVYRLVEEIEEKETNAKKLI